MKRVAAVEPAPVDLVTTQGKREEPRIPFGTLVERGLLKPGDVLVDASGRHRAKVRADGTVISADARGSIHQVGAHVQGAPACNGWAFWYLEQKGKAVPIELLRQRVRAEMAATLS
jgi:modification methylase